MAEIDEKALKAGLRTCEKLDGSLSGCGNCSYFGKGCIDKLQSDALEQIGILEERVAIMSEAIDPLKALVVLKCAGYITPAQYNAIFARIKADDPNRCKYCKDDCESCGINKGAG